MRLILIVLVGLVLWSAAGGPYPRLATRPVEPDPGLRSFQETIVRGEAIQEALTNARGQRRIKEDPVQQTLRRNVQRAEERLNHGRCQQRQIKAYVAAATAFLEANEEWKSSSGDIPQWDLLEVKGERIQVSKLYNARTYHSIQQAVLDKKIGFDQFPTEARRLFGFPRSFERMLLDYAAAHPCQ